MLEQEAEYQKSGLASLAAYPVKKAYQKIVTNLEEDGHSRQS